jgi:4-hydroxy-tetrahydrodipicolinate reductase
MKVAIAGATGKMGEEIRKLIAGDKKIKFAGGLSRKDQPTEKIFKDPKKLGTSFDVIIDFSSAEAFSATLAWAVKIKKPLLSGTTGLTESQKKELAAAAKKIPILWAPNTAPGVHIVKKILRELDIPESFDVQLTEYHHKMKKDRPSGTAIMLQETLKKKRKSLPEPISIRGGGIFGIHRIELMSQGEKITIEHEALGRNLFAKGALDAAAWLCSQASGLHSMDDFLENYK